MPGSVALLEKELYKNPIRVYNMDREKEPTGGIMNKKIYGSILVGMAILIFISCVVFHLSPAYLAAASVVIGIAGGNVYVDITRTRRS